MTSTIEEIARAFSGHRFEVTYPYLAEDAVWTIVGAETLSGKAAIMRRCEESLADLSDIKTEFRQFRSLLGGRWVVVDSTAAYTGADGDVAIVASCDIYEFASSRLAAITSYNIAL